MTLARLVVLVLVFVVSTALVSLGLGLQPAQDKVDAGTWSVVAVDVDSREVGIALATCVELELSIGRSTVDGVNGTAHTYEIGGRFDLGRLVPGVGAIAAQGLIDDGNTQRLDLAASLLTSGSSPDEVIGAIILRDQEAEHRQYGTATFQPSVANFTGRQAGPWAGASRGDSFTVQGNLLAGGDVVDASAEAFHTVASQAGTTLSDAILAALEAGSSRGGDVRCPSEQTALTAFLAVAGPDDTGQVPDIWIAPRPEQLGGRNPVAVLRDAYDDLVSSPGDASDGVPLWLIPVATTLVAVLGFSAVWLVRTRTRPT